MEKNCKVVMNTKGSNKKWTFSNLSKFRYTKHQIPFGFMQYPTQWE